jgi:Flp pilus assembly protein TadG
MRPSRLGDETGSAVVEFALVGALLTVLTVSVLQLALALHVRNTVLDAASEGARFAALADNSSADGIARCRALIDAAIGPAYATDVTAASGSWRGHPTVTITVRTTLPVIGLLGVADALEVSGSAPIETLD